ncbi:Lsr2 family DNA-binding protein [Streptomyces collinus]|uniref:Lsr2 family DNA-binding protein n=1 Tax=Streptomyces collinus TaxID=42684 RepID=UPI0037AE5712
MFGDWQEALQAEGLPLNPNPVEQQAAAARTVARHAGGKEDLVLLLDAVGLPGDDDTLTALLPLIPDHAGETGMNERPLNATEATALSMYYDGANTAAITDATGLTEDEITALAETNDPPRSTPTDDATAADGVEQLLAWAEGHPTASIRNKAARVRGDLAELTARRATDDAQREAEERVTRLKAELEKAQEDLRAVKAGTAPAATVAPTPIRSGLGSGRSREELAAIRIWARANGHPVADAGMIRKSVLEAYDAAHQTPTAKAS